MAKLGQPIVIRTEDDAWDALKRLVSNAIDADDINLDQSSFDWAGVTIHAKGENYHSSLPASFMRGLVDFQDNFLRASAIILRDSAHITKLSNEARADLDLVFVVSNGSTGLSAAIQDQIGEIIKKVGEKLTRKQIVILILSLAIIYGGYSAYSLYLQNTLEIETLKQNGEENERYLKIIEKLINDKVAAERSEILSKAAKADRKVEQVRKLGQEAKNAIFSHSTDVDEIVIQGISVDKVTISDINRRSRRQAEEIDTKEWVRVEAIDAAEAHNFRVKLRRQGGSAVTALVRDLEANRRTLNALWRAETSRKQIMVRLTGRQIGRDLKDAKIMRAWFPRKKS